MGSLLEDIGRILKKGPEISAKIDKAKRYTNSVVKTANDATWQFPCLVSDTIPIDMANTIVRMLDRKYAVLSQMIVSLDQYMDITLDKSPLAHLNRLHQNMKLESVSELMTEEEVEKSICGAYNGESILYMNEDSSVGILFTPANGNIKQMVESHRDNLREYMSDFDLKPFDMYSEADNQLDIDNHLLDKALNGVLDKTFNDEGPNPETILKSSDKAQVPKLLDRDVKKSNDMIPYGLQVRLILVNDKGPVGTIDFILGVKAIMHPVKSAEMIDNISRAAQNKSVLFKLIRWTTGEISLIKDILLNLDEIKLNAARPSKDESPYFRALKRLKKKKIGFHNVAIPHALIPNATIVITSYEADMLRNKYAVDVRNPKMAAKILNDLFLMSFIIIDEGTQTVEIFDDGSDAYQTYALETLERENNLNSNKLGKEIGRMISH